MKHAGPVFFGPPCRLYKINFAIFCQIGRVALGIKGVTDISSLMKKIPPSNLCERMQRPHSCRSRSGRGSEANTGVPYVSSSLKTIRREIYACGSGCHHRCSECILRREILPPCDIYMVAAGTYTWRYACPQTRRNCWKFNLLSLLCVRSFARFVAYSLFFFSITF